MFILKFLIILTTAIHQINGQEDGKGADARSTDVHIGCFSGDSVVLLNNGEEKLISHLQAGDKILAVNHFNIVSTEMLFMLDKQKSKQAIFYNFETASGHKISLTGHHLIPINSLNNQINYTAAKQVQLGDQLYIHNNHNNQLEYSPVINITIELKTGYYAPLTMTGTLLINNIYASCYALTKNHEWAHLFLSPFRWYYKVTRFISIKDPFNYNNNQTDGIHWLINVIYQVIYFIQPSLLQNF